MTYRELLTQGENILRENDIIEYKVDAFSLLENVFSMNKTSFLLSATENISDETKIEEYMKKINMRAKHIPLQHITFEQDFMGYKFYVNEDVLIPRWDTEILVEKTLDLCKNINAKKSDTDNVNQEDTIANNNKQNICTKKLGVGNIEILDMCTGSGCIGISLKKLCKNSVVTAVDLSKKALEVARKNAKSLDADVTFLESDLFEKLESETFDIIVSNPPYIRTNDIDGLMDEVKLHEPFMALDGSFDGLKFYREITTASTKHLKKNGYLIYEIGCDQAYEVRAIMKNNGFDDIETIKDLAGLDRVIYGRLDNGGNKNV